VALSSQEVLERLDVFVGEWEVATSLAADPVTAPRARTTFEWLSGRRFLVQRWEVDLPEAPDGIAIIGFHPEKEIYLQHYFDSRGVARVYDMTFDGTVWRLVRHGSDFSQRFRGTFTADRNTISGAWEISDDGSTWEHDFDLTYRRFG
jgi:hypothetical protein